MDSDTKLRLKALQTTIETPIPEHYPERTKREMIAGRRSLLRNLAESAGEAGGDELVRRFGRKPIKAVYVSFDDAGVWHASAVIRTAAKTEMQFDEPLLSFPSEFMIAQIALVA